MADYYYSPLYSSKDNLWDMILLVVSNPNKYADKFVTVKVRDKKRFLGVGWRKSHDALALKFGTGYILVKSRKIGWPIRFSRKVEPLDYDTYFDEKILRPFGFHSAQAHVALQLDIAALREVIM